MISDDETVQSRSGEFIYRRLNCPAKAIQYYQRGGHVLLRSLTASRAIHDIMGFLAHLE